MKIFWNEATSGSSELVPLWNTLREYFPQVAHADTDVHLRHLPLSGGYVRTLYTELLNNRAVVENTIGAQEEGFDAVVLGCWADPLWEAREVVDIPVVGIGEASMLLATTLGHKFAVITVAPGVVPTIEIDLRLYGMEDRFIHLPVRALDPPSDADLLLESIEDPYRRLIPTFERVAHGCIEDGAEVIVVGCGYYGPILSLHGYREIPGTGVPVVDCSAAGLKMAEMLVGLRESIGLQKSTAGYFRSAPEGMLDQVRRAHGLA
jgi:allantoin racemase